MFCRQCGEEQPICCIPGPAGDRWCQCNHNCEFCSNNCTASMQQMSQSHCCNAWEAYSCDYSHNPHDYQGYSLEPFSCLMGAPPDDFREYQQGLLHIDNMQCDYDQPNWEHSPNCIPNEEHLEGVGCAVFLCVSETKLLSGKKSKRRSTPNGRYSPHSTVYEPQHINRDSESTAPHLRGQPRKAKTDKGEVYVSKHGYLVEEPADD